MPPRPKPRRGVRVHIILDRETLHRLDALCDTVDRSRSDVIGRLIDQIYQPPVLPRMKEETAREHDPAE
jgi:predicted transcriptional regulator